MIGNIGIVVNVSNPLVAQSGAYARKYDKELSGYSHKISAWLGYDTATIQITIEEPEIDDWFENGIGRHIEVFGPETDKIFEGFVNEIEINYGTVSVRRGPLLGISNLVYALYAPVDATTEPPTIGDRTVTTGATNALSVERYGTVERMISVGELTATEAEQIRDTYLAGQAEPETGKSISIGNPGSISITLRVAGYAHWFGAYLYSNTGVTGYVTASARITNIINSEINSFFNADRNHIATNGLLVVEYEGDYPTAMDAIREMVDLGDANDRRYTFGIYDNRVIYYQQAPEDFEYFYRMRDPSQRIYGINRNEVAPWQVRPAKWLRVTDLLIGSNETGNIYTDKSAVFIESVTYTAPLSLSIEHSSTSTLERKLAKVSLGLGI